MTRISIIGSGIIGTATGKGFQAKGNDVIFYDISKERLGQLENEGHQISYKLDEIIPEQEQLFDYLVTVRTALEQMPAYQNEKLQYQQKEMQQHHIDEMWRLERERQAYNNAMHKRIKIKVKVPHCTCTF